MLLRANVIKKLIMTVEQQMLKKNVKENLNVIGQNLEGNVCFEMRVQSQEEHQHQDPLLQLLQLQQVHQHAQGR